MSDEFSSLSDISSDAHTNIPPRAQRFRDEIAAAIGRNAGSGFRTFDGNQHFRAVMNSAYSAHQEDREEDDTAVGYGPGIWLSAHKLGIAGAI